MSRIYLFVYGTLKLGYKNHDRFYKYSSNIDVISTSVKTEKKYIMYPNETKLFPYVEEKNDINSSHIYGHLYKIDRSFLDILDMFEGVPKHYLRKEITVVDEKGKYKAYIYFKSTTNKDITNKDEIIDCWTKELDDYYYQHNSTKIVNRKKREFIKREIKEISLKNASSLFSTSRIINDQTKSSNELYKIKIANPKIKDIGLRSKKRSNLLEKIKIDKLKIANIKKIDKYSEEIIIYNSTSTHKSNIYKKRVQRPSESIKKIG
jgi:gamma-glutamylcyclotransferase (GGCT)/AIG2-like uncharacterized protein YtfP